MGVHPSRSGAPGPGAGCASGRIYGCHEEHPRMSRKIPTISESADSVLPMDLIDRYRRSRGVDTIRGVAAQWWISRRLRTSGAASRTAREVLRRRVDGSRLSARQNADGRPGRRLIVCGDDPLAHRIVEELVRRYRVQVTVILPSRRRGHGPDIERVPGVDVVES